jgi:putative mobilization protein
MKGYHMPKNVKDKVLSARITYQQYDKLSKIALELDMSRSEIISCLIDNGTVNSESIKKKELDSAIITYFARPFNNINQIAKKLNIAYKTSGNIALEVILRAQEDLYKIQSVLTEILSIIRSNYDS